MPLCGRGGLPWLTQPCQTWEWPLSSAASERRLYGVPRASLPLILKAQHAGAGSVLMLCMEGVAKCGRPAGLRSRLRAPHRGLVLGPWKGVPARHSSLAGCSRAPSLCC